MMNRFLFFSIICYALIATPFPACTAVGLPDVQGWTASSATTLPIDPASKDKGAWIRRCYETRSPTRHIDVHFLLGSGPNSVKTAASPEGENGEAAPFPRSDFPVGFGATYERTCVLGCQAIVEEYPYIGVALSLRTSENTTLVLESPELTSADLIRFAGEILPSLK